MLATKAKKKNALLYFHIVFILELRYICAHFFPLPRYPYCDKHLLLSRQWQMRIPKCFAIEANINDILHLTSINVGIKA